ncbi:DUF4124 domain-containing protein [Endozoicomonas gorgoniicola]|uniref:DUF4124 domain-containing protein n=1 Tax=Endozoicomonas gorgoniicola TaxID=1234144 RepID=A0ABT3MZQ1_9GAMM|nr:DUF4124 domain-containing protein [Endozoicomonas gorgoniicola]MCW7554855.1 DUF4124 domain-containing protein [Endozoicomonas gorgoniicola]
MNGFIKTILLLLPLAFSGAVNVETAHAEKVFIWKDYKGVTHYSDRPGPDGMDTDFVISPDGPESVHEPLPDDSLSNSLNESSSDSTSEVPKETSGQPASLPDPFAPETIAFCEKLKGNLNALKAKGRIRLTHEDGREEILDDAGKEQEKQRLMDMMKQYCK